MLLRLAAQASPPGSLPAKMASSVLIVEAWGGAESVPFFQAEGGAEARGAVLEGALLYMQPGQGWQGRENKYSRELLSARLRAEGIM